MASKAAKSRAKPRKTRSKKASRQKPGLFRRLFRLLMLFVGLAIGLSMPWVIWLDMQVRNEFEGRAWDVPSRVYARPLSLYSGKSISKESLLLELKASGYRPVSKASSPGSYSVNGNSFDINRRAFIFEDGSEPANRFRLKLNGGTVETLAVVSGSQDTGLVRLDPAEIASIYPLHDEDRTLVALKDVPELLITGLQSVEDRQFKHHHGVAPRSIARAFVANIKAGRAVQGGSTLTQQLVKNYFLSSERTLARKINEAIMAVLLELHYDKAQILEAYVNEVFLGQQGKHAIHGFGRASEFYFDRSLQDLQTQQIALLVGMVRGASFYNPRRNPQRALQRRNQVLDIFLTTGLLTENEVKKAKGRPLGVTATPRSGGSRYPAFVDLVRRQLRRDYQASDLSSEGLKIYTTLAPSEQEYAQKAVSSGLDDLKQRGLPADLQAALVLADVASGEVRALVGDRVAGRNGFNRALDARRQIGSVIKPLVYLLALEHADDYNLITRINDEPISLRQPDGKLWSPENYDHKSHGEIPLMDALVHSYNQATVQVGLKVGVANLIRKIKQLGIAAEVPAVPASLLGAVELTPIEVTQMFQSLAAGGYSVPLRSVTAVLTPHGELLSRYPLRFMPLENRDAVALLNFALTRVVEEGTARDLHGLLGNETLIAGKTGTTNERRDSWFVGYTRDLVAASWVGLDDNRPASVTGSNAAMRLWAGLFRHLPIEAVDLRMPDGANFVWVDKQQQAWTDPSCPGAVQIPFIEGSEPQKSTRCLKNLDNKNKKSLWRKLFGRKD
ncbi:MAG: penicillin-binding protein 1B [Xanthomonadales bacterium]|nr:penicillin-binding protein 1B [Xanthomonadales bacterium]